MSLRSSALHEAVAGRDPDAARALVEGREGATHPFYGQVTEGASDDG